MTTVIVETAPVIAAATAVIVKIVPVIAVAV